MDGQLSFAQKLAHSTDPALRAATVATLAQWIRERETANEAEYLKLWKALFYTVWHSDKVLVQQELVFRLATLLRSFPKGDDPSRAILYLHTFFITMRREWLGLDRLRLDKFMSLIRRMVGEGLRLCAAAQWSPAVVAAFVAVLRDDALSSRPDGIRYHVVDVFVEELCAVAPDVPSDALLALLAPFLELCTRSDNRILFSRICKEVFRAICDRVTALEGSSAAGDGSADAPASSAPVERVGKKRAAAAAAAAALEAPLTADAVERSANTARALRRISLAPLAVALWKVASQPSTSDGLRPELYALHEAVANAAVAAKHAPSFEALCPVEAPSAAPGHVAAAAGAAANKPADGAAGSKGKKRARPAAAAVALEQSPAAAVADGGAPAGSKKGKQPHKQSTVGAPPAEQEAPLAGPTAADSDAAALLNAIPTVGQLQSQQSRVVKGGPAGSGSSSAKKEKMAAAAVPTGGTKKRPAARGSR